MDGAEGVGAARRETRVERWLARALLDALDEGAYHDAGRRAARGGETHGVSLHRELLCERPRPHGVTESFARVNQSASARASLDATLFFVRGLPTSIGSPVQKTSARCVSG